MTQEIKTIKELADRTYIQEWAVGCDSMNNMVDNICLNCAHLKRDDVYSWVSKVVSIFNEENDKISHLFPDD